ncbi:MAG: SAM-dependent methyltransferase [Methanobacteriota archaeon]|nr:MAG: SAM-dependent methyltransferase [Euryarchaeota archaeon]|tara:strand:+ start:6359 stop:7048 length:690 start_codon:yes stop_codon:yes gene_type:complete
MNNKLKKLRAEIKQLSKDAESSGTPLSWFEELYLKADRNSEEIPWARMNPHPKMVEWIKNNPEIKGNALVVGCGLGDDAEWLVNNGFNVTAFDVSKSSIEWCQERFPHSLVNYCTVDLLSHPHYWEKSFDLIVEIHILQAIPEKIRESAAEILPKLLTSTGNLLCIGRLLDKNTDDYSGPPWSLKQDWLENKFKKLQKIYFSTFSVEHNYTCGDFPNVTRYIGVWKNKK